MRLPLKSFVVSVVLMVWGCRLYADVAFTLASSPRLRTGAYQTSHSVIADDFNSDGKMDLAAAISGWKDIAVFTNDGRGGFPSAEYAFSSMNPMQVVSADFNGDGKADLLSLWLNSHGFTLVTNSGSNPFFASQPIFTWLIGYMDGFPSWVIPTDANRDGSIDLITQIYTNTILVLTNDGAGVFKIASSSTGGDYSTAAVTADVNGDGKQDLISANYYNTLSIVTNDGGLGYAVSSTLSTGQEPNSVAAADFNGDSRVDLACANRIGNTLSVFTNASQGHFHLKLPWRWAGIRIR